VIGLLARFFKGALTIPMMLTMKWNDVLFWYDIYELQVTEEEIVQELKYDKNGKEKKLPPANTIRELVNERIEERKIKDGRSKQILDECSNQSD